MWEERLCFCPDGDFFKALRRGKADVVTDVIKAVTPRGIELESGQRLDADIIITATGLKVSLLGGTRVYIDGELLEYGAKSHRAWRSCMLSEIPNMGFVIGYADASWTLGSDASVQMCGGR